jgi:hypothetical protein
MRTPDWYAWLNGEEENAEPQWTEPQRAPLIPCRVVGGSGWEGGKTVTDISNEIYDFYISFREILFFFCKWKW